MTAFLLLPLLINKFNLKNDMNRYIAVFLMIFSGMASAAGESLIIEDVVLIDGTGRQPVEQISVLVQEDRIVEIKRGQFSSSQRKGARVIDAKHKYLDQALYQAVFTKEEIEVLKNKTRQEYQDRDWTWWMKLMTPVAQDNLRQINAAGGILALGTDQTNGPAVHREMELLAAAGIPALDIIRIATLHGAKFLGKEDQLGSIQEGKLADMVLLDADPLEDINNAKKVYLVIKYGSVIDRKKLNLPVNY